MLYPSPDDQRRVNIAYRVALVYLALNLVTDKRRGIVATAGGVFQLVSNLPVPLSAGVQPFEIRALWPVPAVIEPTALFALFPPFLHIRLNEFTTRGYPLALELFKVVRDVLGCLYFDGHKLKGRP